MLVVVSVRDVPGRHLPAERNGGTRVRGASRAAMRPIKRRRAAFRERG